MITKIEIRPAVMSDAGTLSQLIIENARVILLPHYNEEQWDVFSRYYSMEAMQKKIGEQHVFCAELNRQIVGTIALDKDAVVGFYTRLQYLHQGIGKQLMQHLEAFAIAKGLQTIQLAASPEGVRFYAKTGWQKLKEAIVEHDGVGYEETLMLKNLSGSCDF